MIAKYAIIECYSCSLVDVFNSFNEAFEHLQDIRKEGGCYHIFKRMEPAEYDNQDK